MIKPRGTLAPTCCCRAALQRYLVLVAIREYQTLGQIQSSNCCILRRREQQT